jgi:hypothetical protein
VGGVAEQSLLELGPLEGAHSWMLERAGAASVVAIESNTQAYLKCLVTNALLGMKRVQFLAGDFMSYLEQPGPCFDAAVACGVLYHLRDPQRLFPLLAKRCRGPVLLWTQYWTEDIAVSHPRLGRLLGPERVVVTESGTKLRLHRHSYRTTRFGRSFWGGNASYSEWLDRSSLEAAIRDAGYDIAATAFDEPRHPNGPAVAMTLKPRMRR